MCAYFYSKIKMPSVRACNRSCKFGFGKVVWTVWNWVCYFNVWFVWVAN